MQTSICGRRYRASKIIQVAILILTFMFLEAYTALALVFTAKAIIRREDMSKNSLFFLAGTMINVTYSIMAGLAVKLLMGIS